MNKTNRLIRILSAGLVTVASLVMVILAIVNLVNNGKGGPDVTIVFRVIICVLLILAAIFSTCFAIAKDPHHFDVRLVVYNGMLLGLGIFFILPQAAADIADKIVGYLIPCLLIGLGIFFMVATIISLINKINKRGTDILAMIIGVLLIVVGALLLSFAPDTIPVMWLVIGALLLVYSIFALVAAIKKEKAPLAPKNPDEIN